VTGPKEPGDEDWGFPEVDPAGPTATELPEPETDVVHDTGSDAWWRAQADAQRQAAAADPVVPPAGPPEPAPVAPPELVEPEVLVPEPGPLDQEWLPADLPELHRHEPEPQAEPQPVAAAVEGPAEPEGAYEPYEPYEPEGPYAPEEQLRAAHETERVGPARAAAGAAIAVAGVALGISALFLLGNDDPKGGPTVPLPPSASASPTASASSAPTTAPPTTSPAPAPASPVPVVPTAAPAQAPVVPVSVLNNSRIKGLASQAADRFRDGGWPVATQGNYSRGVIRTTTVYYAPGQQASAQRFARQFGIARVAPRFPGLPTQGMTVVLTRDYSDDRG
jgi:hypothetical protein